MVRVIVEGEGGGFWEFVSSLVCLELVVRGELGEVSRSWVMKE